MSNAVQRVVFITGASSGIGKELTQLFLHDGFQVCMVARRLSVLNEFANTHPKKSDILTLYCDVCDKKSVKQAIQTCESTLGPIEILIVNAGVSLPTPTHILRYSYFETVIQTNFLGAMSCVFEVSPLMMKRKRGHIVGIGSLAAYRGLPESSAYCSSKAALMSALESIRQDLTPYNIKVSIINPGFIKTPLTEKNKFKMPFLQSLEKACQKIYRAIIKEKHIYAFPFRLAILAKTSRFIPAQLYDFILRNKKNLRAPH